MDLDKKIDEILYKFRKNNGVIKVNSKFKIYYRQNENVFRHMIDNYKLITPIILGKMSLTKFGREVCKKHGWKHYKLSKLEEVKSFKRIKIKKRIISITIAIFIAATPFIFRECNKDARGDTQEPTNQLLNQEQNP